MGLGGNDLWTPLLRGFVHTLQFPRPQRCDESVRKAMVGLVHASGTRRTAACLPHVACDHGMLREVSATLERKTCQ
eukprot:COSAG02_NODE_17691_length_987_cov_0.807432_1_plen_76_part_01